MSVAHPWWLLLGLLTIPVVALHLLRPLRRSVEVTSIWLWKAAEVEITARKPWQKLRVTVPLLLQLLATLLLAVGAAVPVTSSPTTYAAHTVFLLDNSASMGATDVQPTRFAELQKQAKQLRRKLPGQGMASIVTTDGVVQLSTNSDSRAFDRVINRLTVTSGTNNIATAALLAKGLQTAERDTGFVLLSDGQLSSSEQKLLPLGVQFTPIGKQSANVALTDISVDPTSTGHRVVATVTNLGNAPATAVAELLVDGQLIKQQTVSVATDATQPATFTFATGKEVLVRLRKVTGADFLSGDDEIRAIAGDRRKINVQLVTTGDPNSVFIERALQSLSSVEVGITRAGSPTASVATDPDADLIVFDRVQPPANPGAASFVIAPPQGFGPVTVSGPAVEFPSATLVRSGTSLLTGLDLSDLIIQSSQVVNPGDTDVLVAAPNAPLLLRGRTDRHSFVYLAFAPADSTLALDISFPLLIDRIVTELGAGSIAGTSQQVGASLPATRDARMLTSPEGRTRSIPAGELVSGLKAPGFWKLNSAASGGNSKESLSLAVNTPASESTIAPVGTLRSAPSKGDKGLRNGTGRTSRLPWLVGPLLLAILAEWLLVRRRVGVSSNQWKRAQIVRALTITAALGALLAPAIRVPTRNVSTVFAIDASDSVGPGGRRDAVAFVEAALADMPTSARAGVVVFGGTAQVTAAVQRKLLLGDTSNLVDASNTDFAGALRLASAASPTDAARRVVLVSDGRRTVGDERVAAQELADEGVRVDAAVVGQVTSGDVAVESFRVPVKARAGEKITLRANLQATDATPAEVVLKSNGREVSRSLVQLEAGDNSWNAEVDALSDGVASYSIEVVAQGDPVVQNDVAYATTAVNNTARVLILRGDSSEYSDGGNGAGAISDALEKAGLAVSTKSASSLDGLEDLAGVSGVILVDVHRRELDDVQVNTLTAAVRELGIGLTVLGGTNSFGSGSYLGSRLEELLPVISEVNDPKRRTPVAQAILIDTSGSMSIEVDGKRTALDLAKAGALGSASALRDGDKLGVMGVDDDTEWVRDVSLIGDSKKTAEEISKLKVGGGTVLEGSLTEAAAQLADSDATVRHILVLSDGLTANPAAFIQEAARMRAQGITVSVMGAGPDIEPNFSKVAVAGGGRFIPGTDFKNLPALFTDETQTVARNLVSEGSFVPDITGSVAATRELEAAPVLKGFQSTTARPTARTALRVGPYRDPLLATWQAGLGRVTTWTSDGGQRWASGWNALPVSFWAAVVKDTFLSGGSGSVRASVDDDRMVIRASGTDWPAGATATATVRDPDGRSVEVTLRPTGDGTFIGDTEAPAAGTYAIGVSVSAASDGGALVYRGGSTAIRGYSSEYQPGTIERDRLTQLSKRTGGRGIIDASQVFDRGGLVGGRRTVNLGPWLFALAGLLWVLGVLLWRVPLGKLVAITDGGGPENGRRTGTTAKSSEASSETARSETAPPETAPPETAPSETASPKPSVEPTAPPISNLDQLLAKTREDRSRRG